MHVVCAAQTEEVTQICGQKTNTTLLSNLFHPTFLCFSLTTSPRYEGMVVLFSTSTDKLVHKQSTHNQNRKQHSNTPIALYFLHWFLSRTRKLFLFSGIPTNKQKKEQPFVFCFLFFPCKIIKHHYLDRILSNKLNKRDEPRRSHVSHGCFR